MQFSDAGNHDHSVNLSHNTLTKTKSTAFNTAFNEATQRSFVTSSKVTFWN